MATLRFQDVAGNKMTPKALQQTFGVILLQTWLKQNFNTRYLPII